MDTMQESSVVPYENKRLRDLKKGKTKRERRASSEERSGLKPAGSLSNLSGSKTNLSSFFSRNFSVKKKSSKHSCDLSVDANNPGVLKVFGNSLQEGTDYKSVLYTSRSTSGEILAEVLERFGLARNLRDDYLLCDVVGRMTPLNSSPEKGDSKPDAGHFVEEYHRTLQMEELISKIHQLWTPIKGLFRRFEIRNNVDGDREDTGYISDNETRGVNNNARRIMGKSSGTKQSPVLGKKEVKPVELMSQGNQTEATMDIRSRTTRHIPLGPYLLLLKGFDQKQDLLIHELYDVNVVGHSSQCDIQLFCSQLPDVFCNLVTEHSQSGIGQMPYTMFLEPMGTPPLYLNGNQLASRIQLHPGDFINLDDKYVFLFKDTSHVPDRLLTLGTLGSSQISTTDRHIDLASSPNTRSSPSKHSDIGSRSNFVRGIHDNPSNQLSTPTIESSNCVSISSSTMLEQIFREFFGLESIEPEVAATLIAILCQYATRVGDSHIQEEMQWSISEAICTLSQEATASLQNRSASDSPLTAFFKISVMSFLLSEYFQSDYELRTTEDRPSWQSFFGNITRQTFDDIVKLGYEEITPFVGALYEDNPFTTLPSHNGGHSMEDLLAQLSALVSKFGGLVHPASVHIYRGLIYRVMLIMSERVTGHIICDSNLLRWSRGVQLRGNLDKLEEWFQDQSLLHVQESISVLTDVVDLLTTPKAKLFETSWTELRDNFEHIPASVLHRILTNYENCKGAELNIWIPDLNDEIDADYDPLSALQDQVNLLLREHVVIDSNCQNSPLDLIRICRTADFSLYIIQMDSELQSKGDPSRWRPVVDQLLKSTPVKKTPPSSTSRTRTNQSKYLNKGPQLQSLKTVERTGSLTSRDYRPGHNRDEKPDSAYSSSTSRSQRHDEIQHLKQLTRSLQNLAAQSSPGGRKRDLSVFDVNIDPDTTSDNRSTPGTSRFCFGDAANSTKSERLLPPRSSFGLARDVRSNVDIVTVPLNLDDEDEDSEYEDSLRSFHEREESTSSVGSGSGYGIYGRNDTFHRNDSKESQHSQHANPTVRSDSPGYKEVFTVELSKDENGSFGLALIDGETTDLNQTGIYVGAFRPGGPADLDQRLKEGDRILAVNEESIINRSYEESMTLLRSHGSHVKLLAFRSDPFTVNRLLSSLA